MDLSKYHFKLESTGSEQTKTLVLPAKIGRRIGNKVVPSETNGIYESQVLSRNHAEIYAENGKVYLKDLESSNGTFVDGERITKPTEIKDGSNVDFGVVVYDEDGETVKHDKVSVIVRFVEKNQEAEDLPEVVVRSLPPNTNLKSEETHDLLLQIVLSILVEETKKQGEIDLALMELNGLLDSGELTFKGPEPPIVSETIKLQREAKIYKKKISDLEAKIAELSQKESLEAENATLKKEIEESKASVIKAQKEVRAASILQKKIAELNQEISEKEQLFKEMERKYEGQLVLTTQQNEKIASLEASLSEVKKQLGKYESEGKPEEKNPQDKETLAEALRKLEEKEEMIANLTKQNETLTEQSRKDHDKLRLFEGELGLGRRKSSSPVSSPTIASKSAEKRKLTAQSMVLTHAQSLGSLNSPSLSKAHVSNKIRSIQLMFEKTE